MNPGTTQAVAGESVEQAARAARRAAEAMAAAPADVKQAALEQIVAALQEHAEAIVAANRKDLRAAEQAGLSTPLLKRLKLDQDKLAEMIAGLRGLIALPDPVGTTQSAMELDRGLELYRVSCPIGVIGVIFESRPDALVQISALCLKSGNAVLLKGGSEALQPNRILTRVIAAAAAAAGLPEGWVTLLETRADVESMLRLHALIDLVVPRGSNAFVRHIMQVSEIPVLGHADGICHVYLDAAADPAMAVEVTVDSKCQYVAVCNAAETLLVHQDCAPRVLPAVAAALRERGVALRGCERTRALIDCQPAEEQDWGTEYLDLVLAVRVVPSLEAAVEHIHRYGSGHTDTIVSDNRAAAEYFLKHVDSGSVFWNCSTRFSDGYRYGLGAEVGVSTARIHARGPVGMEGLLIYKWKLLGSGQTVADYASGSKTFTHRPLSCACPLEGQ